MSQVPDRAEPSSAGEINYEYIFQLLHELGYNKWIGCEYNPQGINMFCLKFPDFRYIELALELFAVISILRRFCSLHTNLHPNEIIG